MRETRERQERKTRDKRERFRERLYYRDTIERWSNGRLPNID